MTDPAGSRQQDSVRFTVATQSPTLDHYRREWTPGPGVGLAGMWLGAVVSDAAGRTYWGLRGADDFVPGMTHVVSPITGFKRLPASFDPDPPHLFAEYSTIDWFEPMTYTDIDEKVTLSYPSGRIERDTGGLHWYDAAGRWEMHGTNVTDVFTVHVSVRDGDAEQVYYRHELMAAAGTIQGVPVSGYLHQDYAYGPGGSGVSGAADRPRPAGYVGVMASRRPGRTVGRWLLLARARRSHIRAGLPRHRRCHDGAR